MGAASGTQSASIVAKHLEERLWREPYAFEFFQAVRLLENLFPSRSQVGQFPSSPSDEIVRFSTNPSFSFPPSEIQELTAVPNAPAAMKVNFMGLFGAHGVLPQCYTEFLLSRIASRDTALADFLDLFHHRLISLFYQAWRKYRTRERGSFQPDVVTEILFDLIGLGIAEVRDKQALPDENLLSYAGLLTLQCRSAATLERMLSAYFEVPVQIEQFAGGWYRLASASQCTLDESEADIRQLGNGAVVGDEVWEPTAKVRIVLGPMCRKQYLDFLPSGRAYASLKSMVHFFSDEIDFEAQLVLASDGAPPCELGASGEAAPLLGWMSWVTTRRMNRDPADTIIPL
jgi:type VI secretion system protein ImpH